MKRSFLLAAIILTTATLFGQTEEKAPYLKFKSIPPFRLLLPDSSTYYTKADLPRNKAVILIMFSPMCEHCQHETEEITKHIDDFKNVQIVMSTSLPFDSMLAFRDRYHLADYKNIVVAHDPHFFLIPYFQLHNMPFMAFYNKKKEFISVHEGSWGIENVIEEIKK